MNQKNLEMGEVDIIMQSELSRQGLVSWMYAGPKKRAELQWNPATICFKKTRNFAILVARSQNSAGTLLHLL